MNKRRIRRIGLIKSELLCKSREASLAAVQILNNLNISFEAESYIVLMIIDWQWYERWVDVVRKHCQDNRGAYS
jgi:hypothetical protein